jgi:sarcosine oxidase, subunit delta
LILVPCPYCGPRNSTEFAHWGENHAKRPGEGVSEAEWGAYLYLRQNPAGWTTETWFHRFGCARFFVAERNTLTNEVRVVRPVGDEES